MEVMKCDRCGKIHEKPVSRTVTFKCKNYDLCPDCSMSLDRWVAKKD